MAGKKGDQAGFEPLPGDLEALVNDFDPNAPIDGVVELDDEPTAPAAGSAPAPGTALLPDPDDNKSASVPPALKPAPRPKRGKSKKQNADDPASATTAPPPVATVVPPAPLVTTPTAATTATTVSPPKPLVSAPAVVAPPVATPPSVATVDLSGVEAQLGQLANKVGKVENNQDDLSNRMTELETRFSLLQTAITGFMMMFNGLGSKIDKMFCAMEKWGMFENYLVEIVLALLAVGFGCLASLVSSVHWISILFVICSLICLIVLIIRVFKRRKS